MKLLVTGNRFMAAGARWIGYACLWSLMIPTRRKAACAGRFLNWCQATCQLPVASCNRCLLP